MALAIQMGTAGSGRTLVPPAPSPWPPGSLSGLTAGCSVEEGTHLAPTGSAEEDLGGREGRGLCGWAPQAKGQRARYRGHRQQRSLAPLAPFPAAKEASSMPHRKPLPAPQHTAAPGERRCSQSSARRGKSKIKAVWRRERQRRREGKGEPDPIWLHQWDQWLPSVR